MLFSLRATFIALAVAANMAVGNAMPDGRELNARGTRNGQIAHRSAAPCTKTVTVAPHMTFGPTMTVWTKTKTTTEKVDCEGCKAITTAVRHLGAGPVVEFTTTVTAKEATTTTVFACKK